MAGCYLSQPPYFIVSVLFLLHFISLEPVLHFIVRLLLRATPPCDAVRHMFKTSVAAVELCWLCGGYAGAVADHHGFLTLSH